MGADAARAGTRPVLRWIGWALVVHHVLWPLVLLGAVLASAREASAAWAGVLVGFVYGAPITLVGTLLHVIVVRAYAGAVVRRPAIEATAAALVRNCAALSIAAAALPLGVIATIRLARLAWVGVRWTPVTWSVLLGVPIVVGFVNLLLPRLVVPSLRRGTWPGPARDA